jgi:hypothetical protein
MIIAIISNTYIGIGQFENFDNLLIKSTLLYTKNPIFYKEEDFIKIEIENSSILYDTGKPMLPITTKVLTFPFGSEIIDVDVNYHMIRYNLSKKIYPCPRLIVHNYNNQQIFNEPFMDESIYCSNNWYPKKPVSYHTGSGLQQNEHVLFLIVNIIPQYNPIANIVNFPIDIYINVTYTQSKEIDFSSNDYDLVIITSEDYSSLVKPLADHKSSKGIQTLIKTTGEIYDEYSGRDQAEQIKYFIKDMIETYGVLYFLFAGDTQIVPMRKCSNTVVTGVINWHEILSDLYYADIYDSNGGFSSWDTNNNEKYCECYYDFSKALFDSEIIDEVDLYPDVRVGRIPCGTIEDFNIVVDKIIHYETSINGNDWFNRIILMGGDTTPDYESSFEGEWLHETYIGPEMSLHGFDLIKLYTSLDTFQPVKITEEISLGASFVSYAGHGNLDSIGTYPPLGTSTISYTIQDINELANGYKLPVFLLDACLTGKIDYDIFDKIMIPLTGLYPNEFMHFLKYITDMIETKKHFPCFAGSLLTKELGGGIAVVAATQPGLTGLAYEDGEIREIIFGSSNLNRFFFDSYEPRIILSDIFVNAQNLYINNIRNPSSFIMDYITLNEFNLFGDPSLKIGGYT